MNKKIKIKYSIMTMILVFAFSYIYASFTIPSKVYMVQGKERLFGFSMPVTITASSAVKGIFEITGDSTTGYGITPSKQGEFKSAIKAKIYGVLPIKDVNVSVIPKGELIAVGRTAGIKLYCDGVMVASVADGSCFDGINPSQQAGLAAGDIIKEINGKKVETSDDVSALVNKSDGATLKLLVEREGQKMTFNITPKLSVDGKLKIGLWVRDSMAGIGTITFYDPESGMFGALGHGISDIDTGKIMPMSGGGLIGSRVMNIRRGEQGSPGELKGTFELENNIGSLSINCETGIYGKMKDMSYIKEGIPMAIGFKDEVMTGSAKILSNIESEKSELFEIEILKLNPSSQAMGKNMLIRVTDARLLASTGGIVQGMSGSPIMQREKLIGAVTHVLVNDPERGYGIFIENMLENIFKKKAA